MTETERKALALMNEVREEEGLPPLNETYFDTIDRVALCRAIEQHEAYKQEVSDALEKRCFYIDDRDLGRFIIPKPDPLVEAFDVVWPGIDKAMVEALRAAIEKRGGKIVWGEGA